MSSYRGAWDGGPPGAEGEYGSAPPAAPPPALPTTDPWTGVSYSQYGPPPAYDYRQYGAYGYSYDPSYYQRPDGGYYGKYPDTASYPPAASSYEYPPQPRERTHSPVDSRGYDRRKPYRSNSRSASPYDRRERAYSRRRDSSYEEEVRRRRSRSRSSRRKKYSSSRSSSRSRSYSHSSPKKDKKRKLSASTDSSASDKSYKKTTSRTRRSDHSLTPPLRSKTSNSRYRSRSREAPVVSNSISKSKDMKSHSSKETRSKDSRQKDVTTPPRKWKGTSTPTKASKKSDRCSVTPPRSYKISEHSVTPPKSYKYKERKSDTPPRKPRDSSVTPPKSYARSSLSSSSKSRSKSTTPRPKRKRSVSHDSRRLRSCSSSGSRSSTSPRHSKRKNRRSVSKHRSRSKSSNRRSTSRSRSKSRRRSKSRGKGKRSASPHGSKSRSRSHSSKSRSHSRTPSEDERRGQFTVADRKRFWKMHRSRKEEKSREAKTPPKEVKPPPGAVESTHIDDIEYGVPPEVEGPNFAEMLPPPDLNRQLGASTSKAKAVPIPIKNDGSFLAMFKKMQEATKKAEVGEKKPEIKKPALPFIGKRRGGRVLKTGLVKKAKAIDEQTVDNTPKDAWSLYMQEVKKYRETSCEEERKTRPLVK